MASAETASVTDQWLAQRPRQDGMPGWVEALRDTSAEVFSATGFPAPKAEGWQYTNLRALRAAAVHPAAADVDAGDLPVSVLAQTAGRLVVVNGHYRPDMSFVPAGVRVRDLRDAAKDDAVQEQLAQVGDLATMPFLALNTAHMQGGFVVDVAAGVRAEGILDVLFFNTAADTAQAAAYPRVLYMLGARAGLTVFERHAGQGGYVANGAASVSLAPAAHLRFYRLMEDDARAHQFSCMRVRAQEDAVFEGFSMATGGRVTRQDVRFELIGARASVSMSGIYLMDGSRNHDFTVVAGHMAPACTSRQLFKGVLDDQARTVFQGHVNVSRSAQKTDGRQYHHALLLSPAAEASARPELEIYADDVQCAHGNTSGQIDEDALFYMRSRGIPESAARAVLVESFLAEVVDSVTDEGVRAVYTDRALAWLKRGEAGA